MFRLGALHRAGFLLLVVCLIFAVAWCSESEIVDAGAIGQTTPEALLPPHTETPSKDPEEDSMTIGGVTLSGDVQIGEGVYVTEVHKGSSHSDVAEGKLHDGETVASHSPKGTHTHVIDLARAVQERLEERRKRALKRSTDGSSHAMKSLAKLQAEKHRRRLQELVEVRKAGFDALKKWVHMRQKDGL